VSRTLVSLVQTGPMKSVGSVRTFDPDEGWGVIDGPDVPGGCWVHFSVLAMDGYRKLTRGQQVFFRAEAARQDGFAFRAMKVWTGDAEPPDRTRAGNDSAGYFSWVVLPADPRSPDEKSRRQV
jgi:CspA family cold shock protein